MALQKQFETFLKDTLGVNLESLREALTSEDEVQVEFSQGTFLSDESLEDLKSRVKSEGYNEGKVAGIEMEVKELKKNLGLEIEGKDLNKVFDAFKTKVLADAKIEPDKKVKDLQSSLERLQSTYTQDLSAKEKEIQGLTSRLENFNINQDLMSELPDNLSIAPKHFLTILRGEIKFGRDESGQLVGMRGDTVIKDKTEKPIPIKTIISDFATNNGLMNTGTPGRSGGGYKPPAGGGSDFKTQHDLYKHMEKNKIDPMSKEGQALIENFEQQNG